MNRFVITIKKSLIVLLYIALAYSTMLMIGITLDYMPIHYDQAFLAIKQTEVQGYAYYLPVFYTHVFTAILALITGSFQFSKYLQSHYIRLHRLLGYIYIISILLLAGPSGFIMGWHANGGWIPIIMFVLLAIFWWWYTWRAWRAILHRDIQAHKNYMILSFALTLSAITLRWWKVVIIKIWDLPPMDAYVWMSILGWIPNLLIAKWLIIKKYHLFLTPKYNK